MGKLLCALWCLLCGMQVLGSDLEKEAMRLGDMLHETPFKLDAFTKALKKSPLGKEENIDFKTYRVGPLLVQASYMENLKAMQAVIDRGADIQQMLDEERGHDLITVLLSAGKFIAAAYLYDCYHKLPAGVQHHRDEASDQEAEEHGRYMVKVRTYRAELWAKKAPILAQKLQEAKSFTWKDFLGLVMAVGGNL